LKTVRIEKATEKIVIKLKEERAASRTKKNTQGGERVKPRLGALGKCSMETEKETQIDDLGSKAKGPTPGRGLGLVLKPQLP